MKEKQTTLYTPTHTHTTATMLEFVHVTLPSDRGKKEKALDYEARRRRHVDDTLGIREVSLDNKTAYTLCTHTAKDLSKTFHAIDEDGGYSTLLGKTDHAIFAIQDDEVKGVLLLCNTPDPKKPQTLYPRSIEIGNSFQTSDKKKMLISEVDTAIRQTVGTGSETAQISELVLLCTKGGKGQGVGSQMLLEMIKTHFDGKENDILYIAAAYDPEMKPHLHEYYYGEGALKFAKLTYNGTEVQLNMRSFEEKTLVTTIGELEINVEAVLNRNKGGGGGGGVGPKKNPAKKTPAKKSEKKPKSSGDKKNKKKRTETYSSYIYKVLKQVHADNGINAKSMSIINSFVNDAFERIAVEAGKLVKYNKKGTLSSREIQTAVRLNLPGELAKHAVSEGTKAVTKYTSNAGKGGRGGSKKKATSRSAKAGLQFPVGRVHRPLGKYASRIGAGAPVYLAAVLEYLAAEVLELAGNATNDLKMKRITPRHVTLAVRGDEELDTFLKGVTIAQGGVIPHIHKSLLKKKDRGGKSKD